MGHTTEIGLNIATGKSVDEITALAEGMSDLLDKYTVLMTAAGRSDEIFGKMSKALGVNNNVMRDAVKETKKVSAAFGADLTKDNAIKKLTQGMSSQFKGMAKELKTALSGIPIELQKINTSISNMTTLLGNQLGSLKVHVSDITDALKMSERTVSETSKGSDRIRTQIQYYKELGATLVDLHRVQNQLKINSMDLTKDNLKTLDTAEIEQKTTALLDIKKQLSMQGDALSVKGVNTLLVSLKEELSLRKSITDEASKAASEDRRSSFSGAAGAKKYDEAETLALINKVKENIDTLNAMKADKGVHGVFDVEELKTVEIITKQIRSDMVELSEANADMGREASKAMMSLRTQVAATSKEMAILKINADINYLSNIDAALPKLVDLKQNVQAMKESLTSDKLSTYDIDTLIEKQKQLKVLKDQSGYLKSKEDTQAIKGMTLILNQALDEQMAKERQTTSNQKKEIDTRLSNRKEEITKSLQMTKTDLGMSFKLIAEMEDEIRSVRDVARTPGAGLSSLFGDPDSLREFTGRLEQYKALLKELPKYTKNLDETEAIKRGNQSLAATVSLLKELASGVDMGTGERFANLGAVISTKDIDLLERYKETLQAVDIAKKKLSESKGSRSNTDEARREYEVLKRQAKDLEEQVRVTGRVYESMGLKGTEAMHQLSNAKKELNARMSSLDSSIKGTERSFKNMWGSFTIGMGKFLLAYHTISTFAGMIGSVVSSIYNFGKSFAETGSKLITLEKQIRDTFGGSEEFTNREMARLKQLSDYYGVVTVDIAKYYATVTKQLKEMGATDKFSQIFKENAIAAIRGAGLGTAETENVFRALQQLLSKNQPAMEEITQQLSEHLGTISIYMSQYLGKVEKDGKKVYAAFANIRDVVDLKEAVSKGKVAMNDFVAAVTYGLGKIGEQAKNSITSYESEVSRLKNAWNEIQVNMMKGTAGFYLAETLQEVTDMLKDPEFQAALVDAVGQITRMVAALTKVATAILPELIIKVTDLLDKIPGVDAYKPSANANSALKAAFMQTEFAGQTFYKDYLAKNAGVDTSAQDYQRFYSENKNTYNREIGQLYSTGSLQAFKDGFAYFEDGVLKMAKNSEEALKHQKDININNTEDLKENVTDPLKSYIDSGKASWGDAITLLTQAVSLRAKELGDYSVMSQVASNYGSYDINYGSAIAQWPAKTPEVMGPTTESLLGIDTGLAGKVNKPSEADQAKMDELLQRHKEKLEAYKNMADAAEEEGNWARKMVQSQGKISLDIMKDQGDFKKLSAEKQQELFDAATAAGAAQQTQLYTQAMRELENIDAEIESRIAGGNLKNELKTQYEDIIKWQIQTVNKLEKSYTGLEGVDLSERYSKIQQAVERASEQALTQGNTPMEVIARAEKRAIEGRKDAWQATFKELVQMESQYSQIQVQHQFDLMQTTDDINGKRTEKEKQRIQEAYTENLKNFKETQNLEVAKNLAIIAQDEATASKRKEIFGSLYDASGQDEAALALQKLEAQLKGVTDAYGASAPVMKEYDRLQQEIIDNLAEKDISNASNFTEYLSKRFAKENGLLDNATVATTKQFETMYERAASGAEETGQAIETAFTESFTGTGNAWKDLWNNLKAIAVKTLAEIVWAAKANPIKLSVTSWLTGVTPAMASGVGGGASSGLAIGSGQNIDDLLDKGSNISTPMWGDTSEGAISKMSQGIDDMTKSINDFGKDVLGMTTDLTKAMMGAGIGFGIATVMFPENQLAKIGGTIGGAAGQIIGDTLLPGIGGAVGTAVGSVLGGVIGNLFGGGKKVTDAGIRVTVDDEGLQFIDKYEKIKKSGGLDITKVVAGFVTSGMTGMPGWNQGSKYYKYSNVDPQVYKEISSAITKSFSTVSTQMLSLGLTPDFSKFSVDEMVSLKGEDPEALLQAWLEKLSGRMVDSAMQSNEVMAAFAAVKKSGETSSETLERLVSAMQSLEDGAADANVSIEKLAGGLTGLDLASYASDLSDALGGSSGVSDFFSRIEEFVGYTGTEGISNLTAFEDKFQAALLNINNFSADSNTRTSVLLGQQANLETTQAQLETKLSTFAAGGGWRKWLSFDGSDLTMNQGAKYSTVEEMSAADPKWKAVLDPMIAAVAELKNTNAALDSVATKLTREENLPATANIKAGSSTFWADYTAALENISGMTPELVATWDAAAKVAQSIATMRDKVKEAREALEEQNAAYNAQRETFRKSAVLFNSSAKGLKELSLQAQAMNQSDLPAWFEETGNVLVDRLVPGLGDMIRSGETAFDTLERLTKALNSTEEAASLAGVSVDTISGGASGINKAAYTQALVDYFGSQDTVNAIFSSIGDAVYTDDQLSDIATAYWKKQVLAQGEALGAGDSVDAIKEWIKGQLTSGDYIPPEKLSSLGSLSDAINNMDTAAGDAGDSVSDLAAYLAEIQDKINRFGMTDTQSFLADLETTKQEMRDNLIEKGGVGTDTSIVDVYGAAAIKDRLDGIMDGVTESLSEMTSSDYDTKLQAIVKTTQENIAAVTLLGASEEQLSTIRAYEAAQINELKKAHTDYVDSIQDKINAFGQNDTDSFLSGLMSDAEDMRKQLINLGGAKADTSIVDTYIAAAIADKIKQTTDTLEESIRELSMDSFSKQIYDLKKATVEGVTALERLGASEEDIAMVRYEAALKAKEIVKSAAQAYIQAYDDQLSKIEELESERQSLIDAVSDARNDYISALEAEINTKQEAIDSLQENVDTLKEFISSLDDLKASLLEDAGFLSSTEKAGLAMANFEKIAALAATGDTDARSKLSSAATSAASAAAEGMSYDQYIQTFARIYGKVDELQADAKKQLTPQEQQLEALIASRDSLQAIVDRLNAEADKALSIADAAKAYQDAQTALAQSTLDAQIAALEAEAAQHETLVEQLRKQYDETVSLSQAAKQYFDTVSALSSLGSPEITIAETIAERTDKTNALLDKTLDVTSRAKKTADRTYDKVDELLYFMQEDNRKLYKLFNATYHGEFEYTETVDEVTTDKVDIGLKVILSNAQVKASIIAALSEANNLSTVPETSVIGLLNGIKSCACECQCTTGSCVYYGDVNNCDSVAEVINPEMIADSSGLADEVSDKIFSTIGAAIVYAGTGEGMSWINRDDIILDFASEDPDCSDAMYMLGVPPVM